MPTLINEQETTWVDHLAGRLRLIQADAAEASPDKRREYLQEEVTRALKEVPQSSRKRLLSAALSRFPVGGQVAVAAAASAPAPAAPPPPDSPDQLLQKLLAVAPQLDPQKRAEFLTRLAAAGLAPEAKPAGMEVTEVLRQKLGLEAGNAAQTDRVVELAAFLTEMFARLDQACLKTTREIAPKSRLIQRQQDFRTAAGAYLTGNLDSLEPQMRAASSLVGTLLAALLGGGRDFGRQFVETLSPTAIENVVDSEGVGILKNRYQMYWERYKLLSRDFATADLVDRRVRDSVSSFMDRASSGS